MLINTFTQWAKNLNGLMGLSISEHRRQAVALELAHGNDTREGERTGVARGGEGGSYASSYASC